MAFYTLVAVLLCALLNGVQSDTVFERYHLTWEEGAPNGQSRNMTFVNGQFPGPPLIVEEGDDVVLEVFNWMDFNTTVHFHGIEQDGTPWSDGVPGLSQKPIQPGESYVYKFKASPAGTHWYHSHERMTLVDGLHGAIFVKPKQDLKGLWSQISNAAEDVEAMDRAAMDPKLMVLSDWSRLTSEEYWKGIEDARLMVFCVDSILLNGEGEVYCPPMDFLINETIPGQKDLIFGGQDVTDKGCFPLVAGTEGPFLNQSHLDRLPPHMQSGCVASQGSNHSIEVDAADGWVSLNFIAAATNKQVKFQIDSHDMWIYEINGNYVKPHRFVVAAITAGERFSVMVKLDQTPGRYTIRLPDSGATQIISAYGEMVYKGGEDVVPPPNPYLTYGGKIVRPEIRNQSFHPFDVSEDKIAPWPAVAPAAKADEEYLLVVGRAGDPIQYTMNTKYLFPMNFSADDPMLYNVNRTLGTVDENLVIRTKNGSWVDLIVQVGAIRGDESAFEHMLHKHGSKTWRIGNGSGIWNYSSVAEAMKAQPENFNLKNPGYRDSWLTQFSPLPTGYWIVLRYQVTNPGPWLFHCHFETHAMGGMAIAILDGVDAWPEVPEEYVEANARGWQIG